MTEASKICKICFESYDNFYHRPYEVFPCGHVFGDSCIFEMDIKQCPICGSKFDLIIIPNIQMPIFKMQSTLPPILTSRKKKTVYLFGHSGHGKSSFINFLYDYDYDIVPTPTTKEYKEAYGDDNEKETNQDLNIKEGNSIKHNSNNNDELSSSFTKRDFIYYVNQPILGHLDVIDTIGLNTTAVDNNKEASRTLLNLALLLYNSNRDLKVDTIIYILSAKHKLNQDIVDKDIDLICKMFKIENRDLINNYLITICTNCNSNLSSLTTTTATTPENEYQTDDEIESARLELEKTVKEVEDMICNKYRVPFIKWDNKVPFKNQLEKLKMNMDMVYSLELNFEMLEDRFKKIDEYLREQDKEMILTSENLELEKKEIKDQCMSLKHADQLEADRVSYTKFALSKLYPILNNKVRKRIEPKFEKNAQIKRVKNIRNRIIREENVIGELLFAPKLSFDFDEDLSDCTIMSEIYFYPDMKGRCFIEYEIKYDLEFELPTKDSSEFKYKELETFRKKSIELFLSKLNDAETDAAISENNNAEGPDHIHKKQITDSNLWDTIVKQITQND